MTGAPQPPAIPDPGVSAVPGPGATGADHAGVPDTAAPAPPVPPPPAHPPTPAAAPTAAAGGVGGLGRIAGAAAVISVLTVLARIAGLGRTFVFYRTVGDQALGNLYFAANTIPNVVFELVAGGALASLVVPLLAAHVTAGDRARAAQVTSALLGWVLALTVPLAVTVALAAGPIAGLLHGVDPAQRDLAARMLQVFAPQLPLYGVGIVLTGVLQSYRRFAWPVLAPLLSSVTVMTAYLTYARIDGARTDVAGLTRTGEYVLSAGTTLGVVVLALCLVIPLRRLRLHLRPTLRFPGDEGRRAVRLGWAGAVTVGAQQVVVALVVAFAANGPLALYTGAQTVFLLPWAVLAVPLATAAYPRLAAAAAAGDEAGYADALSGTTRSLTLLACLGAAALAGLSAPVAVLVGAPGAAPGILGFAPGLLGYALFALLSRALYARGATRAAAVATAAGWGAAAIAVLVAFTLPGGERQVFALGAANALGMTVIGVLLALAVRRQAGRAALAGLGRAAGVGIVSAGAAALAGRAVAGALGAGHTVPGSLVQAVAGGVVVLAVYAAVVFALDRRDLAVLGRRLRRTGR